MKRNLAIHTCVKIACTALFTILIYRQDLLALWNEILAHEWANYALVVPCVTVYFIYRRRKALDALISASRGSVTDAVLGMMICGFSFVPYVYGAYTPLALYLRIVSMVVFLMGSTLFLFGRRVLQALAFPLCYLFLLYPLPISLFYWIGRELNSITAALSLLILTGLGMPVVMEIGYEVQVMSIQTLSGRMFTVAIDVPCSGVYSLIGFITAVAFLMYVARGSLWKKVSAGLIGCVVVYLLNVLRVCVIMSIGHYYGQEVALNTFHTFGGWILILITALALLFFAEKLLKIRIIKTKVSQEPCSYCGGSEKRRRSFCEGCGRLLSLPSLKVSSLSLFLKLVALSGVVLLFASTTLPVFTMENIQILAAQGPEVRPVLPDLHDWTPVFSARLSGYEERSREDMILIYFYVPRNKTQFPPIRVIYEVSSVGVYADKWENCILDNKFDLNSYQLVTLQEDPKIVGYSIVASGHGTTMVVLAWAEPILFRTDSTAMMKTVGVSLVATMEGFAAAGLIHDSRDYQGVINELMEIGGSIVMHWQPVREMWLVNLLGYSLRNFLVTFHQWVAIAFTALIIGGTVVWAVGSDKKALRLEETAEGLSEEEKLVLMAVAMTGPMPTGSKIYEAYKELGHDKALKTARFFKILYRLEKLGLIKRDMIIKDEQPLMIWRSNLPAIT